MQPNNYNRTSSSPVMFPMRSSYGTPQQSTSMLPMTQQPHGACARLAASSHTGGPHMRAVRRGAQGACAGAPTPRRTVCTLLNEPTPLGEMTSPACAPVASGCQASQALMTGGHLKASATSVSRGVNQAIGVAAATSFFPGLSPWAMHSAADLPRPRVHSPDTSHCLTVQCELTAHRHRLGALVGANFQPIPAYATYSSSPR
jgi:hypothetical protein